MQINHMNVIYTYLNAHSDVFNSFAYDVLLMYVND